jgi:hypothetical protein
MKKLVCVLMSAILASTSPVVANECTQAVAVETPCRGVLLPKSFADKALIETEQLNVCRLEHERVKRLNAITLKGKADELALCTTALTKMTDLADKAIGTAKPQSFWDSGTFAFVGGVVTGLAVGWGSVWLAGKL